MNQIYYKTESTLDNYIIIKILSILWCMLPAIPLLQNFTGKSGILRKDNWTKCMNITLNPQAILILLMDLDNDQECVSDFYDFLEKSYWNDYKRTNCNIFLSIRMVEIWLMADIKSFSNYFWVPEAMIERIFQESEYDIRNPKLEMKNLIKNYWKNKFKSIIDDDEIRYFLAVQSDYMKNYWNPIKARDKSKSLNRMIQKLDECIN